MSKHTPAPWVIESGGARIIQTTACVISANDGLGPVAFSTTANAQLISAAPELLEALKEAIKTAKFESHPFRAWHSQARAAIQKAEGKA